MTECERLTAEIKSANARERPAFMAGAHSAMDWDGIETYDYEQAWQQYRCNDDTDWRTVSDKEAAKIDAAVSGSPTPA